MAWYDDFNINELLSSPGASIGVPLGLGLMAGATPGTARAAHGLIGGVNLVSQAQRQKEADLRRRKLQELVPQLFGATNTVETPAELPPSDRMDVSADAELPAVQPQQSQPLYNTQTQTPLYSPQVRNLGMMVGEADPAAAISLAASQIPRPPAPLHPLVERNLESQIKTRELPKPAPLPPRPVYHTAGGETISSVYNPAKGIYEESRSPVTPAPRAEDPLLALREQDIRSRIASRGQEDQLRQQRLQNLRETVRVAKDPKATLGQLSASLNALVRERDSIETPEEDKPEIQQAIRAIRGRLAQNGVGMAAEGGAPMTAPTAAPDPNDPLGIRRRAEY